MRALVSRLARLEQQGRLRRRHQSVKLQFGHLKQLPADYIGERHVVVVRQIPPQSPGEDWYEFEERPGRAVAVTPSESDDLIIQVHYVESMAGLQVGGGA